MRLFFACAVVSIVGLWGASAWAIQTCSVARTDSGYYRAVVDGREALSESCTGICAECAEFLARKKEKSAAASAKAREKARPAKRVPHVKSSVSGTAALPPVRPRPRGQIPGSSIRETVREIARNPALTRLPKNDVSPAFRKISRLISDAQSGELPQFREALLSLPDRNGRLEPLDTTEHKRLLSLVSFKDANVADEAVTCAIYHKRLLAGFSFFGLHRGILEVVKVEEQSDSARRMLTLDATREVAGDESCRGVFAGDARDRAYGEVIQKIYETKIRTDGAPDAIGAH